MAALLTRHRIPLRRCGGFRRRQSGGVYTWRGGDARERNGRRDDGGLLLGTLAGAACGAFLYLLDRSSVEALGIEARPPSYPWRFQGYLTSLDHSAVRRGWQVYRTVCCTCHSLGYVRFMDLVDVSHTADEAKAIAAEFEVQDGPNDEGNYFTRPAKLTDRMPPPYPNEEAARAANFGTYPPDLTYIIEARKNGRNYLFSLLTGWMEPPAGVSLSDNQYFNIYFPGNMTRMAQILTDGIVEYDDGTPSTTSQMAKDTVEFLTWTSAQEFDQRKLMFIKAMGIFAIMLAAIVQYQRHVWSYLRSRQIAYVPKGKY